MGDVDVRFENIYNNHIDEHPTKKFRFKFFM